MRLQVLTAVLCMVSLGCSNVLPGSLLLAGDKNNHGEKPEAPAISFHPYEVPANPAAVKFVQDLFLSLKLTHAYVPEDAAFMKAIIVGDKVRDIYRGSHDRTQALAKLKPEGYAFMNRLVQQCKLVPAARKDSGRPKPGVTVTTTLQMSVLGCDYSMEKSLVKNVSYSQYSTNQAEGSYSWNESYAVTSNEQREVLDKTMAGVSNLKALTFSNTVTGSANYTASKAGYQITALLKGAGQAQVVFADGEVLQGPVHSESRTDENGTTVKVRFDGKTSRGDILIMVLRDTKSVLSVYVNGVQTSNDILDAFGLNLMEVASRRN